MVSVALAKFKATASFEVTLASVAVRAWYPYKFDDELTYLPHDKSFSCGSLSFVKSLSPIAPGHGQASVQIYWSTISVYCPAKFKLASIFFPFMPGILTFPSQANLNRED